MYGPRRNSGLWPTWNCAVWVAGQSACKCVHVAQLAQAGGPVGNRVHACRLARHSHKLSCVCVLAHHSRKDVCTCAPARRSCSPVPLSPPQTGRRARKIRDCWYRSWWMVYEQKCVSCIQGLLNWYLLNWGLTVVKTLISSLDSYKRKLDKFMYFGVGSIMLLNNSCIRTEERKTMLLHLLVSILKYSAGHCEKNVGLKEHHGNLTQIFLFLSMNEIKCWGWNSGRKVIIYVIFTYRKPLVVVTNPDLILQ